jgi:hypothetical protein
MQYIKKISSDEEENQQQNWVVKSVKYKCFMVKYINTGQTCYTIPLLLKHVI